MSCLGTSLTGVPRHGFHLRPVFGAVSAFDAAGLVVAGGVDDEFDSTPATPDSLTARETLTRRLRACVTRPPAGPGSPLPRPPLRARPPTPPPACPPATPA